MWMTILPARLPDAKHAHCHLCLLVGTSGMENRLEKGVRRQPDVPHVLVSIQTLQTSKGQTFAVV